MHLKFGVDGGGGFLKICLSIQSIDEYESIVNSDCNNNKRDKYDGQAAAKKLRGVKKIMN